ncbi:MAG: serpin family protein [Lachnospiraceae bacterium]|nr:serpin family protein [Lachnospiraceae bacterium]
MKRIIAIVLAVCMIMGVCGCDMLKKVTQSESNGSETNAAAQNESESEIMGNITTDDIPIATIMGLNTSGLKLFETMRERDKNIFISPLSIYLCYSMLYAGSDGKSKSEMRSLFGFDNDTAVQTENAARLMDYISGNDQTKLYIANSLWLNSIKAQNVKTDYRDICKDKLKAEVHTEDYSDPETVNKMNSWVFEKTGEMIDHIIDELDPEGLMALFNCVFFDGKWMYPFEAEGTYDEVFYSPEGEKTIPFMHQEDYLRYFEDAKVQAVSLPYTGDQSMVIVLPKEGSNESDPLARLDIITTGMSSTKVVLSLPKADLTCGGDDRFMDSLKKLGLTSMFDPMNTDFKEIDENSIYVTKTLHKTALKIDEEGTKAAAVTVIEANETTAVEEPEDKVYMKVDRPYYVVIMDKSTGAILFCGYIVSPME